MFHYFGRFFPVRSRSNGSRHTGRQSVGGTTRADRGVLPIDRGDEGAAPPPPLKPRAGAPLYLSPYAVPLRDQLPGQRGRRAAVLDAELAEQVGHVHAHRLLADEQGAGWTPCWSRRWRGGRAPPAREASGDSTVPHSRPSPGAGRGRGWRARTRAARDRVRPSRAQRSSTRREARGPRPDRRDPAAPVQGRGWARGRRTRRTVPPGGSPHGTAQRPAPPETLAAHAPRRAPTGPRGTPRATRR